MFKMNKITFVCIDQVRAVIKIDGPYAPADEKSVGTFKNVKSATNIYALQHNIQQWLFISKGATITSADGMDLDGWYVNIFTEKNKIAPSQHWIRCVFDKNHGLDKFWSEFTFLSEMTPGEMKIFKNKNPKKTSDESLSKMPFKLCIQKVSTQVQLVVVNPEDPSVNYRSQKFYKKDAKKIYNSNEEFRQWFDYAVDISVQYRIIVGLFRSKDLEYSSELESVIEQSSIDILNSFDVDIPETNGESNNEPEEEEYKSVYDEE